MQLSFKPLSLGNDDPQGAVRWSSRPMRESLGGLSNSLFMRAWSPIVVAFAVYPFRIIVRTASLERLSALFLYLILHRHFHLHGTRDERKFFIAHASSCRWCCTLIIRPVYASFSSRKCAVYVRSDSRSSIIFSHGLSLASGIRLTLMVVSYCACKSRHFKPVYKQLREWHHWRLTYYGSNNTPSATIRGK
jgi:hypothetical protein